jgi:hypothetical protein
MFNKILFYHFLITPDSAPTGLRHKTQTMLIIATKSPRPALYGPKDDEIEMEPGFPGRPKVPRDALATVVPGTEMEPRIPVGPREPGEALATVVPGTVNLLKARGNVNWSGIGGKGTANNAAKAPGAPGTVFVAKGRLEDVKALGIGEGLAVELVLDRFTGSPRNCKLLDFSTPRRDKVAGFCGSIRYERGRGRR